MTINYIDGWMRAEKPHLVMRTMRANGWLRDHAPEVDRLYGIPQRSEHHPEIDAGVHTELALEVAGTLSQDPRVRYAALVHDLGKALTPKELWPRHHGHEELGVESSLAFGGRLGVPQEWRVLGAMVCRYHLHAHRSLESSARSIVRLFRDAGLFERPDLIEPFTLACEADARGRAGLQDRAYPQGELLRTAFGVAHGVEVASPLKLHETRIQAVREALALSD